MIMGEVGQQKMGSCMDIDKEGATLRKRVRSKILGQKRSTQVGGASS